MLNVDPSVVRGEETQVFEIEHNGQKLIMKLYRQPSTGKLKVTFNGPLSFSIRRYKQPLLPVSEMDSGS